MSVRALLLLCGALVAHGCTDAHHACFYWAAVGQCESNGAFMSEQCAASCGLCEAVAAVAVDAAGSSAAVVDGPQLVLLGGRDTFAPLGLQGDTIASITAGASHLMILTAAGHVHTWGDNRAGQLGFMRKASRKPFTERRLTRVFWPAPHAESPAIAVAAGHLHSAAVLADGSLMLWGDNAHGQCGVLADETPVDPSPTEIDMLDTAVAVPMRAPLPGEVVAASCGETHTLALTRDGRVWAFGDNSYGQAGQVTEHAQVTPLAVSLQLEEGEVVERVHAGSFHSLALTSRGAARDANPPRRRAPAPTPRPCRSQAGFSCGATTRTVSWAASARASCIRCSPTAPRSRRRAGPRSQPPLTTSAWRSRRRSRRRRRSSTRRLAPRRSRASSCCRCSRARR
jgi:hypothetical protein